MSLKATAEMETWKHEYLVQMRDAEKNNPVNLDIIEACTSTPRTPLSTIRSPAGPL